MPIVIEQRHSLRRELLILGLVMIFGFLTVVVLLVPGFAG